MTLAPAPPRPTSAAPVVRRVVVYTILFVLVVLVASGLSDLLHRVFDLGRDTTLAVSGTGGLASSLTFTLIGGPLAALLGWFAWQRLADPRERDSVAWALYLVGVLTVSVVVASSALLTAAAATVTADRDDEFVSAAATGLVWAGVWAGHRFVLRNSSRTPSRLSGTAAVLGGLVGLVVGVGGAVSALTILFDRAILGGADAMAGSPWWVGAVQAALWAAGGGGVWWWHWSREGGRSTSTALAAVALVGFGILGGCLLALAGTGAAVFVLLRLAVDRTDPFPMLLNPLGLALSAALVGGLVWVYHRGVVRNRRGPVRDASALTTSGIALVATATGIGVVVNALLAALTTPLATADPRTLLLGGLSSVLVGGLLWWFAWSPVTALEPGRRRSAGRGVYLVVIFGVSAVVALVTLLVIGFLLFDTVLSGEAGLLERVRAPLGLLVATGLVAGYHFSIWRNDRAAAAAVAPTGADAEAEEATTELVLIMGSGGQDVVAQLARLTGAQVTYWQRTGVATVLPGPGQIAAALDGVAGKRVVLMVATDGTVSAIPVVPAS